MTGDLISNTSIVNFENRFRKLDDKPTHILIIHARELYNFLDHANADNGLIILHFLMGLKHVAELPIELQAHLKHFNSIVDQPSHLGYQFVIPELKDILYDLFQSSRYFFNSMETPQESLDKIRSFITLLEGAQRGAF